MSITNKEVTMPLAQKEVETFPCECPNTFQDEEYGKGQRIHNPMSGKDGNVRKCTSCGTAKTK